MGSRVSLRPGNGGSDYARRTNMDPYASLLDQGLGDQHAAAEHEQEDHHRRDELQPMLILHGNAADVGHEVSALAEVRHADGHLPARVRQRHVDRPDLGLRGAHGSMFVCGFNCPCSAFVVHSMFTAWFQKWYPAKMASGK